MIKSSDHNSVWDWDPIQSTPVYVQNPRVINQFYYIRPSLYDNMSSHSLGFYYNFDLSLDLNLGGQKI